MDQLVSTCVFRGAPASVDKGGEEGRQAGLGREAQESPTPSGSRIPPSNPSPTRIPRRGKEEEGAGHLS